MTISYAFVFLSLVHQERIELFVMCRLLHKTTTTTYYYHEPPSAVGASPSATVCGGGDDNDDDEKSSISINHMKVDDSLST